MPVDIEEPQVQIAGFAGAAHAFDHRIVHDVVAGARVARGPWAGVVQARVGLAPAKYDPLALTVAEIAGQVWEASGPLYSLDDVFGVSASAELGVPAFGARFSGGPFLSVGVDGALVRRASYDAREESVVAPAETLPAFGARVGVGVNGCLGKNVAVRAEIYDVVRSASIIEPPGGFRSTELGEDPPNPLFVHQVALAVTVAVGR